MVVVEDVNSPIAGLWDLTRGKRLTVLEGFQQGFTDRATALRLLEAQACTGGICDPSSGEKVTLSEALKRGLLDDALNQQLQKFEQAFNGIAHPKTGKSLSIFQAIQENLLSKDVGFRCFEFQLLTGGLINPDTHDRVSLEEVIQSGLVDKATASLLKEEKFDSKSLTCPKTKRRITFREALERSVYDSHTGLRLLEATKRSVDEEKREHGDKVSKLLNWMSSVKQTVSNDGNDLKDSNANTDASNKPQVSVEEMVTKKEQIAEALRATQVMLSKHSDKMTEKEKEKAQEQLKALNQAYNELSQHCSDQATSAEEDFQSTKGIGGLGTAVTSDLMDKMAGVTPLDSQITTSDFSPSVSLDWNDTPKQDLIAKATLNHWPEQIDSSKCIQTSHLYSVSLSEVAAARGGSTYEDLIIKMIDVKQLEEEGVSDVRSGRLYDFEDDLKKEVVDETAVLRLDLESDENESVVGYEDSMSDLKQAVLDGCISSNIQLSTMEKQSILSSDCTININDSLKSGLVKDAEDASASIYPEEDCSRFTPVDRNLSLIKINEAENIQQAAESEGPVMVLNLTSEEEEEEEEDGKGIETENRGASDCEMSNYLHQSTPAVSRFEPQLSSPSSRSQVAAKCINHTDTSDSLAEGGDLQDLIDSTLTDRASDASHVVEENAAQSHPPTLSDRTCRSDVESPTGHVSAPFHLCNSDSSPTDGDVFLTAAVGKQIVCERDLGVSSAHFSVAFEGSGMRNDISAARSPLDGDQAVSTDYSLPRNLLESAIMSDPRSDWNYDKSNTVDGSRITLPKPSVLCSESDFRVESEPSCSENGQGQLNSSSQLPYVSSENVIENTFDDGSCDTENSGSSETLSTNKDVLVSEHSGVDNIVDLCTDTLSPERQHEDIFRAAEQILVSRNEEEHAPVSCLNPPAASSDNNSGQSDIIIGESLGSDFLLDRKSLAVCAENPQDFPVESSITTKAAVSALPVFSSTTGSGEGDVGEIIEKDVSDLEKTQTQSAEHSITIVQNAPPPLDKERDPAHGVLVSRHPDLLMDLLSQNTINLNPKEVDNPELMRQEENVNEDLEQSGASQIQLQLLQVFKTVSLSRDPSVLQEVMETLNLALGTDSQEDRRHTLGSIKEESSEGEDEAAAENDSDLCHFGANSHRLPPQASASAAVCKVEEVKNKLFSIQDYLECVGRLQDHADVLDDVRKDL
ncbi:hypothetical protein Q5P01_021374 [Channa striata]|uniref:Uncharacterized protein n=1 Tax=Channa striata TaxID=64152 RepID=A0AA88S987_CHASR|nr:hypothetical protein Q5P01_021374 [Channa striata]